MRSSNVFSMDLDKTWGLGPQIGARDGDLEDIIDREGNGRVDCK